MQQINIEDLKPHPRNNEFFDDITGENWESFKESIKTLGVVEPIVITKDMTIISGHQRVRACKELGILTVLCECRFSGDNSEDEILQALIETNIRQRGVGNPNAIKLGRCIKELERIYGIHNGNQLSNNFKAEKNQQQLADELGMTVQTLQNYKKLTELIPELEELVDTGILSPTTAAALVRKMTPEEQEKFVASMDVTQKITGKQVQQYIEQQKRHLDSSKHEREIEQLKDKISELESQKYQLEIKMKHKNEDATKELAEVTARLRKLLEHDLALVKIKEYLREGNVAVEDIKLVISQIDEWKSEVNGYIRSRDIIAENMSDLPWMS